MYHKGGQEIVSVDEQFRIIVNVDLARVMVDVVSMRTANKVPTFSAFRMEMQNCLDFAAGDLGLLKVDSSGEAIKPTRRGAVRRSRTLTGSGERNPDVKNLRRSLQKSNLPAQKASIVEAHTKWAEIKAALLAPMKHGYVGTFAQIDLHDDVVTAGLKKACRSGKMSETKLKAALDELADQQSFADLEKVEIESALARTPQQAKGAERKRASFSKTFVSQIAEREAERKKASEQLGVRDMLAALDNYDAFQMAASQGQEDVV